ncbi:MAG: DNA polymerase III subunit beta [Gammaproteobacteria bacterium]
MKLTIQRESLLKPLQMVSGVVERRQSLPVLSNILLVVNNGTLAMTGTDLEVEMIAQTTVPGAEDGEITLPARKFMDICRTLPEQATLELKVEKERAVIRSGKSRFALATLPASEFPNIDPIEAPFSFAVAQRDLKMLIEQTQFAMAHQDVRYYLNGLMLELGNKVLRAVATDGHRLALCRVDTQLSMEESRQLIVPRKGVLELARLLEDSDDEVEVQVGANHIKLNLPEVTFTSKLIEGRFPDYERVVPTGGDRVMKSDREALRQAFIRASVLSNEKFRGIRLQLSANLLKATVHNPEQEEAEEELEVQYQGEEFEIGFNVSYLLDALAALKSGQVSVTMTDSNSSCLIEGAQEANCQYVVMPMRL